MILLVPVVVCPDDGGPINSQCQGPACAFAFDKIELRMIIVEPLFDLRALILAVSPLSRIQGQICRDRHFNGIVERDKRNAAIEIVTVAELTFCMEKQFKRPLRPW